jgi:trigger factor
MKVQVEELSATKRKFSIEIPAERVAGEFERAFHAVSKKARIKGFRPGRVPRPVLERYFADEVRSQVASKLVREGFDSAVEDSKLDIVSQPEVELEALDAKDALRFSATVEIRPKLETVNASGLTAQRPVAVIGDQQVDETLEHLRQRAAELVPIENRRDLARGDFATLDVRVAADGVDIPSLAVDSRAVEVAGGQLPAPVDERLALARVGDTFTVETPAPEGAPENLAGKQLAYTVSVRSIAERRLPELDDEFAKDHGECETLSELRSRLRQQLEHEAQRRAEAAVRDSLVEQLVVANPVALPDSLVARRVEELLQDFKLDLLRRGLRFADEEREAEARDKLRPRAERDVHASLLLDALAEQRGIAVNDEDLAEQIGKIVTAAGKHRDRLRELYRDAHAREAVRAEMRRTRALEQVVTDADVTEVAPAAE